MIIAAGIAALQYPGCQYIMDNIKDLPTDQLLELLAQYTADYTRMAKNGAPHIEYFGCEQVLTILQAELNLRRSAMSATDSKFENDLSE